MDPLTIINLITSAGLPLAMKLVELVRAGNKPVTDAEWDDLKTRAGKTYDDYVEKEKP